jgi:cardiolipin synthase A/B
MRTSRRRTRDRDRRESPPRTLAVSYPAAGLVVALLAGLLFYLWSLQREHSSHVAVPDIARFEEALPSIANLTGSPILAGNRAWVLQNGDQFFPALLDDIARARESIHIETYVWWQGEICRRVARALAGKAGHGVEVRLLVDAAGAFGADRALLQTMRRAGCRVAVYHPFRLQDIGLLNHRTHRKIAVFDGRIAYLFGHGFAAQWTGHAQDAKHWRDTGVRLAGPVVAEVQGVFAQNWVEQTAEVLVGEKYFPPLAAAGPVRAHVTASKPHGGVSEIELLFKLAIATAQKELLIENPYFIPDAELVELLTRAVKRGVDVRIVIPGPVTDSAIVRHAGHFQIEDLLRSGVKLYEYQPTLSHQKVMVIDGVWSHVGSTNLDDRSLDINDEASVGLIDREVAAELRAAFAADLASCRAFQLGTWSRRSAWHRLEDRFSYMLNEEL